MQQLLLLQLAQLGDVENVVGWMQEQTLTVLGVVKCVEILLLETLLLQLVQLKDVARLVGGIQIMDTGVIGVERVVVMPTTDHIVTHSIVKAVQQTAHTFVCVESVIIVTKVVGILAVETTWLQLLDDQLAPTITGTQSLELPLQQFLVRVMVDITLFLTLEFVLSIVQILKS
jgi:hypothetical protein